MARSKAALLLEIGFWATLVAVIFLSPPSAATKTLGLTKAQEQAKYATQGGGPKRNYGGGYGRIGSYGNANGDAEMGTNSETKVAMGTNSETKKQSYYDLRDSQPASGCITKIKEDKQPFDGPWIANEEYCVCINRDGKATTDKDKEKICRLQAQFLGYISDAVETTEPKKFDQKSQAASVFIKDSQIKLLRIQCSTVEWDKANARLSLSSNCGDYGARFNGQAAWTGRAAKLANKDGGLDDFDLSTFVYDGTLENVRFSAEVDFGSGGSDAAKTNQKMCDMKVKSSSFHAMKPFNAEKVGVDFAADKVKETAEKVAGVLGIATQSFEYQQREAVCKILTQAAQKTIQQLIADKIEVKNMPNSKGIAVVPSNIRSNRAGHRKERGTEYGGVSQRN